MNRVSKISLVGATVALAASPLPAAELPTAVPIKHADFDIEAGISTEMSEAEYRRGRWYRGRHRNRVDAGDIILGALIIGGIAAVASSASRDSRDRRDRRDRQQMRFDSSMDRAVDACIDQVERSQRVRSVDSVNRAGRDWEVGGTMFDGDSFFCRAGANGRVFDVDYGQGDFDVSYSARGAGEDRQYSDETYARARAETRSRTYSTSIPPQSAPQGGQADYPGGPVNGEVIYEGGDYEDDGRDF